jgi:YbbR domain-containing protein
MKRTVSRPFVNALREAFTANLGLKAVAFIAALVLVAYQRSQEDERTRTVPFSVDVQLPETSKRRELMTAIPPSIRVTVQGSLSALDELSNSSNNLELDLRKGNVDRVQFAPEGFRLPPGTRIKTIEPTGLDLEWQNIIEREVPVQTSVTGAVAEGHEVEATSVLPETVILVGPERLVNVTQSVRVAPFDLNGLASGRYERQLALDPPPDRTNYLDQTSVSVQVAVRRRLVIANFPKVPVEVVGTTSAFVTPQHVDVTVRGTPEIIAALHIELIVPRVDVSDQDTSKHGSVALPVVVDLSQAEAVIQPPSVKVTW